VSQSLLNGTERTDLRMNRCQNQNELQSLYNNDKISWENEANAHINQSKEERIEKIRSRAYELKAQREAERVEFVRNCYRRQWSESCDEMRALQSKEMLNQIVQDRKVDTQRRALYKLDKANNDNADGHSLDMCILRNEDCDEQLKHRKSILETRRALDKQIELKRKQAAAAAAQRQCEEQEQLRLLSKLEEEARESGRRASEKAKQEQKEVFEDTLQRTKDKQQRRELEKHQDAILLKHALFQEREAIIAEKAKKHDGKAASEEFIRCLQEQTQNEEIENEDANRIRSQQMAAIAKKKEDRLAAEAMERQRQREQIKLSREQQIVMKTREAEVRRRKEQEEVEEAKAAIRRAEEADRRDKEKARATRLEVSPASSWPILVSTKHDYLTFATRENNIFSSRQRLPTRKWQKSGKSTNAYERKRCSKKRGLVYKLSNDPINIRPKSEHLGINL
jgi:hypothetical protein